MWPCLNHRDGVGTQIGQLEKVKPNINAALIMYLYLDLINYAFSQK